MLIVQMQRLLEPLAQPLEEVERTAQKGHLALDLPALAEAGHGLVHHRLEDGGGHILFPAALV